MPSCLNAICFHNMQDGWSSSNVVKNYLVWKNGCHICRLINVGSHVWSRIIFENGSMTCCEESWNIDARWQGTKKLFWSIWCEPPTEIGEVQKFCLHVANLFSPSRPTTLLWREEEDAMSLKVFTIFWRSLDWFVTCKHNY
jgi:hypothetical protein